MDNVPFSPKLIIYGPIISGLFIFILSFSSRQKSAMIENLGEKTAKTAHKVFRYGGPILIVIGIIQYLIKDL